MPASLDTRLAAGLVGLALGLAGPSLAVAAETPAKAERPAAAAVPPPPPPGMPAPPPLEHLFEMLDGDHDGIVTLAEALKGVGEHFEAVDQNKDGSLEKSEFESWFGRANPEAARFFLALYDIDGDGKVARAEFENPVKKRFALFDRNDDGKVTPEEVAYAKVLMLGGPTGLLVPPMSPPSAPPQIGQGAPPMIGPGGAPPMIGPSGGAQMPQPMPQSMGQPMGQGAYGPPPGAQFMPQQTGPAPGVYGPGGQMWNQPVGPMGQGGQGYPSGGRGLPMQQSPYR